jgi:glycosyltransferase involved in cell wall biosynthesis
MTTGGNIRVLVMLEANSVTGSAKSVLEFAREASRHHPISANIELSIVTFRRPQTGNSLTETIRKAGIGLDIVSERRRFDRGVVAQLHAVIENRQPNVIWTNSVKSHFLVRFARLNRSAKWVAFHHGYTSTDIKMQIYNQLDRWSLPAADRVLTVCQQFAKELESRSIIADRIRVQHMPIRPFEVVSPNRVAALRQQLGITDQTRVLLSVGRLSLEKGHADLIRAFRALRQGRLGPPAHLVLVGEGPERSNLIQLVRRLDVSGGVTLVGHQDDVRPYYAIADVFALPSYSEGSPNVLLEAMSAGVPVIATSVGGVPEIVTNETDALLVEKRNVGALASAITRMLRDGELRDRLRHSGQRLVLRHTPEAFYRSIASVLQEVSSAS